MKRSILSCCAVALAIPLLAGTVQAASAAPAPKAPRVPAAAHAATPSPKTRGVVPATLSGYQQVTSGSLADPANTQVNSAVVCPLGTKVVGGGAVISSSSVSENLNASFPESNRKWRVYVNNASGTDGTFIVYAVCVASVRKYSIVTGEGVDDPAGSQVSTTATCPTGTVPLGGGGVASSLSVDANLNSSIPETGGWRADVNNNSADDNTATALVVCGTAPLRYGQVSAAAAANVNPGSQGSSTVACPAGTVVFSGGGFSNSGSVLVDLNSSFPISARRWKAYDSNNTGSATTVRAYGVCGKAAAAAA